MTYPTERELSDEEINISRLPTVLHLLEEAGVVDYAYVPGFYRVFALYGVNPPPDPQVQALLQESGPVNLTRRYGKAEAETLQEKLHQYAREGVLGVTPLAPALNIYVKRWNLAPYEAKCRALIESKMKRCGEFEVFLNAQHCREYQLHTYFDRDRSPRFRCGRCDSCQPSSPYPWSGFRQDLSNIWNPEREVLRLMHHFKDRPRGRGTLIRLLMGEDGYKRGETFQPYSTLEKSSPGYGLLKYLNKTKIEQAIGDLEKRCCVEAATSDTYTVLSLTERGHKEAAKSISTLVAGANSR